MTDRTGSTDFPTSASEILLDLFGPVVDDDVAAAGVRLDAQPCPSWTARGAPART
jgi:hypothetical protein